MNNCIIKLMLGNHAIAHGALEAGVAVAAGYPGTPSSEIMEYLIDYGKEFGVYAEWSSNEKVAFEVAYGAALAGSRAIVTMKHVGLNVAMDPLMSSAYTGVKGGFAIVTADDPNMWSSQNEQDNRWVGIHAYIPVFEPYDPQSAKDFAKNAIEFSETHSHPVLLRSVTRVSHVRGPVTVCSPATPRYAEDYVKDPRRHALIPANARTLKNELLKRWSTIEKDVDQLPHNYIEGDRNLIITSGVAFTYALEAVKNYGVKASVLNVATPVPLPRKTILNAVSRADRVVVIEEGDPVVEQQLKALLYEEGIRVPILGKAENLFNRVGELTMNSVMDGLSKALDINNPLLSNHPIKVDYAPPPRPPVFCPGCPHTASFYELKISTAKAGVKPIFSGDIGCYSLGINNPFNEQDTLTDMGSSLGLGMGIYHGTRGKEVIVSIIGDSTFFHAGLPALVNAIYNKTPMLIMVLDNRVTAMTGGQPNPTNKIDIGVPRALAESVGEHTLLVSYITLILCNEIRRTGANVDASKCLSMALLHDAHEALIGNVGNSVRSMLTDWRDLEVRVFGDLGFNEELNNYFREYRYGLSIEGKLVSIADKLATYMRACKYAMAGYSTEELINNYKELVTRLTDDLPSGVREVIKELIVPISTWCVSKQSNNDKG